MTQAKPLAERKALMHQALDSSAAIFAESQLDFSEEQVFATELLLKNSYSLKVASENPSSLKLAMYNVAMVGLTLNPQLGQAYLIPRRLKAGEQPKIVLDISYRGLIEIGTKTGSIVCAKSVLVYSNDRFQYNGPMEKPLHEFDPFAPIASRGEIRGAFCQAKLPSGDYLIETMSLEEMHKVRDKSDAYQNGVGPWIDWYEQMLLKCPVKRGFKWWPNQNNQLMAKAMEILNEENGEGIKTITSQPQRVVALPSPPPREQVSLEMQNEVARYVKRAVGAQAWEACKELMEQRIKSPTDLAFALNELELAKQDSQAEPIEAQASVVNG